VLLQLAERLRVDSLLVPDIRCYEIRRSTCGTAHGTLGLEHARLEILDGGSPAVRTFLGTRGREHQRLARIVRPEIDDRAIAAVSATDDDRLLRSLHRRPGRGRRRGTRLCCLTGTAGNEDQCKNRSKIEAHKSHVHRVSP